MSNTYKVTPLLTVPTFPHETHDNPLTESLSLVSPGVSATTFSRPLKHITSLLVLETSMSVY